MPNDGSDVYTSVLTIEKATLLDAGQYACQVVDWSVQQCKSVYIEIRDEPDVKVVPMSATIEKVSRDLTRGKLKNFEEDIFILYRRSRLRRVAIYN